ncbi:cytochrome P450 [Aspergillus karnatakaensis]|uniref:cytochrome P450 n=1 Tax=Aspergillus karnatakaensis TaxID=1810916 RepID=UPI003CCCCEBA
MDSTKISLRSLLSQGAVVGIITYWIAWIAYTRWFHPLARFPGPFWASITRVWTVLHVLPGNAEQVQRRLHAKYGAVVRIAPNELVTSDPEAIQSLYGVRSSLLKTDFYLAFRAPWARFPDHFTSEGGRQHADRRRIVNNIYSLTSILESERYVDHCLEIWIAKLGEMADQKESFDLWTWSRMYAYDIIGELYFSKMFGFLEAGRDHLGYIQATDDLIPVQFLSAHMPTYIRGLFVLGGIFLSSKVRRAFKALGHLTDATNAMLKHRLAGLESSVPEVERPDILNKLLNISHQRGTELDFVLDDVKLEIFGALMAGSETTAVTLSGILFHIFRTSRVYKKLEAEIDGAALKGCESNRHITYTEAVKLPYLVACVKEGMRMHPITGVSFPRHAPPSGLFIGETFIPPNSRIGANPGVIHFDKSVFGDDADQFRPERWLEDPARASAMDRHLMTFGIGARTCIGKHLSLCEIYKAIPALLKSFSFDLEEKTIKTTSYWLIKPISIKVNVRRRR